MFKSILDKKITTQAMGKILEITIATVFILIGIGLRLLSHPPNFAPIAAVALFGGVYLSKKIALILPLATMAISDIFIGFYEPKLMVFVYGSFLLCVFLGFWLKKHKKWYTVMGISILGSILFFLITNSAVWAFTPWYAKTFSGIVQCYLMALPFLKNTFLGDLFYITIFFGVYEIIDAWVRKKFRIVEKIIDTLSINSPRFRF
ncbi:MAG: DUF6580 family putative transport protein [Patescibacteria group bacterium]